jgi:Tol biopolymer transport system component
MGPAIRFTQIDGDVGVLVGGRYGLTNPKDVTAPGVPGIPIKDETWFEADEPHTTRPSGHETWIGAQTRVFFSTRWDDEQGNLWTTSLDSPAPEPLGSSVRGGHVSVSRCGRYFLVDDNRDGIPLTVGSLSSGRHAHLVFTATVHDGQQSSHAHPYLTADNRWAVYTSNRDGHSQVYGARLPEGLLASLD